MIYGVYEKVVDRESAYERLKSKAQQSPAPGRSQTQPQADKPWYENLWPSQWAAEEDGAETRWSKP